MSDIVAETIANAHEQEKAGNAEEALSLYDKAIDSGNHELLLYSNRGLLLERLQRYDQALQSFRKATEIEPNFRDFYNMGNMLLYLQRNEESIKAFESSIQWRQDYPECWVNKGIAHHALGQLDEAKKNFEQALSLNENFYPALRSAAILESERKQEADAILLYEKAAKSQPQLASAWFELGCALYKTLGEGQVFFEPSGPEGRTIQALDKVIELDPNKQGAWGRKVGVLFRLTDAALATDRAAAGVQSNELPQMFPLIHAELVSTIEAACIQFPDDDWFVQRKEDALNLSLETGENE